MSERKEFNGDASPFIGGVIVTKLKQKTLFACAKSYVGSKTPISGPGLQIDEQCNFLRIQNTYSVANSDLVSSRAGTGVEGLEAGASTPRPM